MGRPHATVEGGCTPKQMGTPPANHPKSRKGKCLGLGRGLAVHEKLSLDFR